MTVGLVHGHFSFDQPGSMIFFFAAMPGLCMQTAKLRFRIKAAERNHYKSLTTGVNASCPLASLGKIPKHK